jgi:two-component system OmpR family response regulator
MVSAFSRTVEADTAREAIRVVDSHHVDVVILNPTLPDSGAEAACREIRARTRAPIIALSDKPSDIERIVLLDTGADDYLGKPVSLVALKARATAHLRRTRLARRVNSR